MIFFAKADCCLQFFQNSGMAGGAMAARLTYRVRSFCSLLEGRPGCIMYICPWGAGYCGSSTRLTICIAPAMFPPAAGYGGGGGAMIVGAMDGCGVATGADAAAAYLRSTNSSTSRSNSLQFFSRWFERNLPSSALYRCNLQSEFIFSCRIFSSRSLRCDLPHSLLL